MTEKNNFSVFTKEAIQQNRSFHHLIVCEMGNLCSMFAFKRYLRVLTAASFLASERVSAEPDAKNCSWEKKAIEKQGKTVPTLAACSNLGVALSMERFSRISLMCCTAVRASIDQIQNKSRDRSCEQTNSSINFLPLLALL